MNYILFGGNGFLGNAFRRKITDPANRLIIIGRKELILNDVEYFSIDRYSISEIQKLIGIASNSIIIDFAYSSVPKTSFEDPIKDFSENLSNVIQHLEFALAIKASRFLYISSGGTVYGNNGKQIINENARTLPVSPYGISKLACEHYVNMYHTAYRLNTCIVRPSNIYGPGQIPYRGQGFISTALALAFENKPIKIFGDGSTVRDFLYVEDFCEALADVIVNGMPGEIYNVGSEHGYSLGEIINEISELMEIEGHTLKVEHLRERPFDVICNVLDCSKLRKISQQNSTTDITTGIKHTWQWTKEYLSNH